ncbi:MAG: MFS transporter [Luteolibacter sp.]
MNADTLPPLDPDDEIPAGTGSPGGGKNAPMPLALWALAIGAFGIGTTEFVITGLLPGVAKEFGITIPAAGALATVYAMGVFFGAPLLTILGTRIPRKRLLVFLTGLFVVGNLLTAIAPTFGIVLVGRVITSLTHGTFFGIGSVLASELVAPNRRASAIAFMFTGLTLANLFGVPGGTWLSHHFDWRATFYAITGIGLIAAIGVMTLIPATAQGKPPRIRTELAALADTRVLLAMGITVLGPAGFFTSITYIAPMLTEVAHLPESMVTWMLMLFGLGLVVGNVLGGKYADRALMPMLYTTLVSLVLVLLVFTFVAHSPLASAICIFLMGAFGFATVSPIQKRVMDKAKEAGAPTFASAVNIGLFNLGNATGAWLGGFVIARGFGFTAPNWAGALLSMGGVTLAILSGLHDRRQSRCALPLAVSTEAS